MVDGPSGASMPSPMSHSAFPVASMVESIVGCKWSVRILGLLAGGCSRPSAILRSCPGLSAKVMNERLRKMTRFTIVQRTVFGEKPPVQVEYELTPFGRRFMRILDEVHKLQEVIDSSGIAAPDQDDNEVSGRSRLTTACSRRPLRGRG